MRESWLLAVSIIFAVLLIGCGGSGSTRVDTPDQSAPATVTFTFIDNAPTTAALQIGSGAFTSLSAQNKQLILNLPAGVSRYVLAYICPSAGEFVIEATKQDGTAFNASCPSFVSDGAIAGTVDATQIAGAVNVDVDGKNGNAVNVAPSATFSNAFMPVGTNDVAFVAFGAGLPRTPKAVRIIRSQTVPGTVNGGNSIVLGAADLTTPQPITMNNIPAGFNAGTTIEYHTANGLFELGNAQTQYFAVPAAATQSGDFYLFFSSATDNSQVNHLPIASVFQRSTGGPITVNFPPPWSFSGPTPAAFPTFPINYSGFSAAAGTINHVIVSWSVTTRSGFIINILASGNYVAGTGVTVPDLRSMPAFAPAPSSGTTVDWLADITNAPLANVVILDNPQPNGTFARVGNQGNFTVP